MRHLLPLLALSLYGCTDRSIDFTIESLPVTITYVQGDEGLDTNRIQIYTKGQHISAREVVTDNYFSPRRADTLMNDSLSKQQLSYLRSFIRYVGRLPDTCEPNHSYTEQLTMKLKDYEKTVAGA